MTLISAGIAMMRYTINYSSNAPLEIQWYLFGMIFLLALQGISELIRRFGFLLGLCPDPTEKLHTLTAEVYGRSESVVPCCRILIRKLRVQ